MRLFWEVAKLAVQRQLTYRAAMLAGLITNSFFGLLRASVMVALYGEREQVVGISLQQAITYTALVQGIIAYLQIFGWSELMESIYSGEVATDLLKPLGYFRLWLARDLGQAIVAFWLRGVTMLGIYALVVPITLPQGLMQWLALILALLLSWYIGFAWRFLVNLSAFWTPDARGISRFAYGFAWIFSGFLMPLRYFPDWFQTFCQFTPFPAMLNTTVEIYLGLLTGAALAQALFLQIAWAVALTLCCQLTLRAGVRSLVIQGG